jgi:hypothetical protein
MAINRGARASSHPTPSHFMATLFSPTLTPCSTQAHTSTRIVRSFVHQFLVCSFVHPIVRSFVRSFMVRSFARPIVRSFIRSFVQIIFVQPLCCRNSDRLIVHRSFIVLIHRSSFVHSPYSSFIQIICALPLCHRNFDHWFVRSFDRSFVRS